jgi:hypothetical protein
MENTLSALTKQHLDAFRTSMDKLAETRAKKFNKEEFSKALTKLSDTSNNMFTEIVTGSKKASEGLADLRKSARDNAAAITAEFMKVQMLSLFRNSKDDEDSPDGKDNSLKNLFGDFTANMAKKTDDRETAFFDKVIPQTLEKTSDAFAGTFTDIIFGSKNSSQAFAAMGESIKKTATEIGIQLAKLLVMKMLFGSAGGDGFFGNGLLGGMSGSIVPSARGNVFSAPALSAYSGAIVSTPTIFPFARGGAFKLGLMGEAGAEAIMPLRRNSRGRLGVEVAGAGGSQSPPQVNVNVYAPAGTKAEVDQQPNNQGGFDITVLLDQIDNSMAAGIISGRSRTANAIKTRMM